MKGPRYELVGLADRVAFAELLDFSFLCRALPNSSSVLAPPGGGSSALSKEHAFLNDTFSNQ